MPFFKNGRHQQLSFTFNNDTLIDKLDTVEDNENNIYITLSSLIEYLDLFEISIESNIVVPREILPNFKKTIENKIIAPKEIKIKHFSHNEITSSGK